MKISYTHKKVIFDFDELVSFTNMVLLMKDDYELLSHVDRVGLDSKDVFDVAGCAIFACLQALGVNKEDLYRFMIHCRSNN